jgi:hypothetical protein
MEVALSKFFAFQLDREWTDIHTYWAAAMQNEADAEGPFAHVFDGSQTSTYGVPPWTNKAGAKRFADPCAKVYRSSTKRELGSQLGMGHARA